MEPSPQATPRAAQLGQIQSLVDELASKLQRSVQVDTPAFYAFCSSPQYGEVDNERVFNVLHREPNPEPIPWLVSNGVQESREPVRVPAHEEFDLLPRLCVPLWEGERLCGHIWVIDSPSLNRSDLETITAYRQPIIDLIAVRDESFVRRVAEMLELTREVTFSLIGSVALSVNNSLLPRSGVIRVHQLTIREATQSSDTAISTFDKAPPKTSTDAPADAPGDAPADAPADAPERLMLELLRFRRRSPFLVTDSHDGLTIIERPESQEASQSLLDVLPPAAVSVGAHIVARGTSTMNELSGAGNSAQRTL